MKKIASFTIDHTILPKGMYLSRTDMNTVTYDIRCRRPNVEDVRAAEAALDVDALVEAAVKSQEIINIFPE